MIFTSNLARVALLSGAIAYAQSTTPVSYNSSSNGAAVDLGYVKYQGRTNATAGINYFRGIPYVHQTAI